MTFISIFLGSAKPFVEIVYVDRVQPNRAPSDIILQTSIQDFMLFLELPFLIELFNFTSKGVEPEIKRESLRVSLFPFLYYKFL